MQWLLGGDNMKNIKTNFKTQVALAFSGGGVHICAYVPIVRFLEERQIEVVATSGVSSGSFLATLIAAGYHAEEVESLFEKHYASFNRLILRPSWKNFGLFSNEIIGKVIDEVCLAKGIRTMADFPVPVCFKAYDTTNGKAIYFANRPISGETCYTNCTPGEAVKATSSFPGVYSQQTIWTEEAGDVKCSDGGARGNISVKALKKLVDDKVPVLACTFSKPQKSCKGTISRLMKGAFGTFGEITRQEIMDANVIIDIPKQGIQGRLLDVWCKHFHYNVNYGAGCIKKQLDEVFPR